MRHWRDSLNRPIPKCLGAVSVRRGTSLLDQEHTALSVHTKHTACEPACSCGEHRPDRQSNPGKCSLRMVQPTKAVAGLAIFERDSGQTPTGTLLGVP